MGSEGLPFLVAGFKRLLFKDFSRFHSILTLIDRKTRHRLHHNTFTTDEASGVLGSLFGTRKEITAQLLQMYVTGQLVAQISDENGGVYAVTRKGECVAADEFDGQVTWVEWIGVPGSGDNVGVKELAKQFARFVGGYPNEWSAEKEKAKEQRSLSAAVCSFEYDGSAENSSGSLAESDTAAAGGGAGSGPSSVPCSVSNFVVAPGITVKDRTVLLKTHTHTFTGSEAVQHLLKHTSCMTSKECLVLCAQFVAQGWIQCVDDANEKSGQVRESNKSVYNLTPTGAQFAGWSDGKTPNLKENNFFSKEGLKGRLRQIAGLARGGGSFSGASSSLNPSSGGDDSLISKENLDKFEEFVKKSSDVLNTTGSGQSAAHEYYEDEGDDGAGRLRARRGTASTINQGDAGGSNTSVASTASAEPAKGSRRPRSATIGSETPGSRSRGSSVVPPPGPSQSGAPAQGQQAGLTPSRGMTSTMSMQNFWEMTKETNATRLTTILMIPALRSAFQKYLATLFCQENYDFMIDVERFRLCYDSPLRAAQSTEMLDPSSKPIVSAVQKRRSGPGADRQGLLFPHALAIYLKYVSKGSPFELNLPSKLQTHLRNTMACAQPYFAKFTSVLDLSTNAPVDPTSAAFRNLVKELPDAFWALYENADGVTNDENVGPWMFSTAEAHIFQMVAGDSVPKFSKTDTYKALMKKLWEEGTLAKVQQTVMAATGGGAAPGSNSPHNGLAATPPASSRASYSAEPSTQNENSSQYVPRSAAPIVGPTVSEPHSTTEKRPRPNSYIPGI
ncbi:hypothetical protein PhCBS80983_g04607 [Powellomyces hirtus]|uniref:DEP domain-containing protein n=1 Tax=Powellomyces hirtus TaxID=109895 RepID=A0A507DX72_9FUNG|nr:hypothetical protein PhCBS80983_g04607 [Powellomyces hirtus]